MLSLQGAARRACLLDDGHVELKVMYAQSWYSHDIEALLRVRVVERGQAFPLLLLHRLGTRGLSSS